MGNDRKICGKLTDRLLGWEIVEMNEIQFLREK